VLLLLRGGAWAAEVATTPEDHRLPGQPSGEMPSNAKVQWSNGYDSSRPADEEQDDGDYNTPARA